MTFNRSHKLAREVTLPGHQELTLTISEPLNAAKTHVLPVKVSARALFNRCSLTPSKGINFGPLQYSSSSKPRSFELANLGEFPLHFRLQASEEQQQPQQLQQQQVQQPGAAPRAGSPSSGKKGAAAKKGKALVQHIQDVPTESLLRRAPCYISCTSLPCTCSELGMLLVHLSSKQLRSLNILTCGSITHHM